MARFPSPPPHPPRTPCDPNLFLERFPVTRDTTDRTPSPAAQASGTYTPAVIEDIQVKAELGRYRIRGFGTLRPRTWATFDDLTFVPCGLTRIPLEGYRESCSTKT